MEESFKDRVHKTFASISSASSSSVLPTSSSMSSLWCLTVDEIQPDGRPEVTTEAELEIERRNDPFSMRDNMEKDLDEFDDEIGDDDDELKEGDKESKAIKKPEDYNDEEWEIKSSIGLDCTLDYEEEEDAYDKVAVGREAIRDEDRLYTKDVNDYEIDADQGYELPSSFKDYIKDPRANHMAAQIRLSEDAQAANKINSLQVCEKPHDNNTGEDNPKSILKRKDNKSENQSQKRVRFDPECKEGDGDDEGVLNSMEEDVNLDDSFKLPPDYPHGIPDYMRNPSKYTKYTFESSDVDEVSNRQAYMDFLKLMKKPNDTESESIMLELPKSVPFVPKKKITDSMVVENRSNKDGPTSKGNFHVSVAAGDTKDDEVCEMEEDEPETIADRKIISQKSSRQYRVKSRLESDEQS